MDVPCFQWLCATVVPAILEAEAGGLLQPSSLGGWPRQQSEIWSKNKSTITPDKTDKTQNNPSKLKNTPELKQNKMKQHMNFPF